MKRRFHAVHLSIFLILFVCFLEIYSANLKRNPAVKVIRQAGWTPYRLVRSIKSIEHGLIDPDALIKDLFTKDLIKNKTSIIQQIYNVTCIVIAIPKIASKFKNPITGKKNTNHFLKEVSDLLFKAFSIERERQLLVLFSLSDNQENIYPGQQIKNQLTPKLIKDMFLDINSKLGALKTQSDFSYLTASALAKVESVLYPKDPFLVARILSFIGFLIFWILFIFCSIGIRLKRKSENNKDEEDQVTNPRFAHVKITLEKTLEKCKEINALELNSQELTEKICVVCLEDFAKDGDLPEISIEENEEHSAEFAPQKKKGAAVSALVCGHILHYDCLHFWYEKDSENKACPCCKWQMDEFQEGNEGRKGLKFNYVTGLIEVHKILNSDFFDMNPFVDKEGDIAWVRVKEMEKEIMFSKRNEK